MPRKRRPSLAERFASPIVVTKRLILEHTKGRLAGLHQILGTDNRPTSELQTLVDLTFPDHEGQGCLIRETPRAIYYRELITPAEANAAHDEFHTDQE